MIVGGALAVFHRRHNQSISETRHWQLGLGRSPPFHRGWVSASGYAVPPHLLRAGAGRFPALAAFFPESNVVDTIVAAKGCDAGGVRHCWTLSPAAIPFTAVGESLRNSSTGDRATRFELLETLVNIGRFLNSNLCAPRFLWTNSRFGLQIVDHLHLILFEDSRRENNEAGISSGFERHL